LSEGDVLNREDAKDAKESKMQRSVNTGTRGEAADRSCDEELSKNQFSSRSPSQLLPILQMGAGAI
jgi:hypothetical protein